LGNGRIPNGTVRAAILKDDKMLFAEFGERGVFVKGGDKKE
jgi:hypothetical protein